MALLVAFSVFPINALGSTTVSPEELPPAVTAESGSFLFNNGDYRESSLTYKNKANYFFLTQDSSYANGSTVYVTFDGENGSVSTTGTADDETVFQCTVMYKAGGEYNQALAAASSTVFVDSGTYLEKMTLAYTSLSANNFALVGLKNDGSTVLKRMPLQRRDGNSGSIRYYHDRMLISNPNIIYQNIVFDADNAGLIFNKATTASTSDQWSTDGGATWKTSGQVFGNSRGEGFIVIPAAQNNFLMKNCTVKNIGEAQEPVGWNPAIGNYAINIVSGDGGGQINFENVALENNKGATATTSFRLVNINLARNVNIRNMTISRGSGNNVEPIWMETPKSSAQAEQQSDVRFDGFLNIEGYTNRMGMQLTSFANLTLPEGFRYAAFSVGTTSPTWSGSGTAADVHIYKSLDDFTQDWPSNNRNQKVIFDTVDNTWLVRQPDGTKVTATVQNQLAGIDTVLQRLSQGFSTTAGRSGRDYKTDAYIKIVADSNGELPGFTVPDYQLGSTDKKVHIKAVTSASDLFSAPMDNSGGTNDTLVPFKAGDIITLNNANKEKVTLYNMDFHEKANYTLHEAVAGVSPDTAKVVNSTPDNFKTSRFTVLAQQMAISVPSNIEADQTDNDHEDVYDITSDVSPFTPTATITAAYTNESAGFTGVTPGNNFSVDDPDILWSSSDSSVASVDPASGLVTIVGTGSVTITATAKDTFNGGEIEKPSVYFRLNITEPEEKTTLSVNKEWSGDDENRPDSVAVQLYSDGNPEGEPVTLSEKNGWTHTWNNLDATKTWTVDEVNVPEGYEKAITGEGTNYTITNTKEAPLPPEGKVTPKDNTGSPTPKTGDPSSLTSLLAIFAISFAGVMAAGVIRIRNRKTNHSKSKQ